MHLLTSWMAALGERASSTRGFQERWVPSWMVPHLLTVAISLFFSSQICGHAWNQKNHLPLMCTHLYIITDFLKSELQGESGPSCVNAPLVRLVCHSNRHLLASCSFSVIRSNRPQGGPQGVFTLIPVVPVGRGGIFLSLRLLRDPRALARGARLIT